MTGQLRNHIAMKFHSEPFLVSQIQQNSIVAYPSARSFEAIRILCDLDLIVLYFLPCLTSVTQERNLHQSTNSGKLQRERQLLCIIESGATFLPS